MQCCHGTGRVLHVFRVEIGASAAQAQRSFGTGAIALRIRCNRFPNASRAMDRFFFLTELSPYCGSYLSTSRCLEECLPIDIIGRRCLWSLLISCPFLYNRHVMLPSNLAKSVPMTHLMTESEWRNLGVQQSPGWVHYMVHLPGMAQAGHLPGVRMLREMNTYISAYFLFGNDFYTWSYNRVYF